MQYTTTDYYKIFKIEKISEITPKELIKRYRILSQKYHPDHKPHGDNEKFIAIGNAYDYLCEQMNVFLTKERVKFFNPDWLYYGDGSIYNPKKGRWIKLGGRIIT